MEVTADTPRLPISYEPVFLHLLCTSDLCIIHFPSSGSWSGLAAQSTDNVGGNGLASRIAFAGNKMETVFFTVSLKLGWTRKSRHCGMDSPLGQNLVADVPLL